MEDGRWKRMLFRSCTSHLPRCSPRFSLLSCLLFRLLAPPTRCCLLPLSSIPFVVQFQFHSIVADGYLFYLLFIIVGGNSRLKIQYCTYDTVRSRGTYVPTYVWYMEHGFDNNDDDVVKCCNVANLKFNNTVRYLVHSTSSVPYQVL